LETDPQAEILISDVIDKKHIIGVCFHNHSDLEEYIRSDGGILLNKYKHKVAPALFKYRKDYSFWQKEN